MVTVRGEAEDEAVGDSTSAQHLAREESTQHPVSDAVHLSSSHSRREATKVKSDTV